VIGPDDSLAVKGEQESLRRNIAAIRVLKRLEAEGREATAEEKRILAQYTGWGGLSQVFDDMRGQDAASEKGPSYWNESWAKKWGNAYKAVKELLSEDERQAAILSTPNAHYTSRTVVEQMWQMAKRLGFRGGRVGEFGAGVGHFIGLTPHDLRDATSFTAVEMDSISSRILKALYPEAQVFDKPLQSVSIRPGSLDMVIGNVPFEETNIADAQRRYGVPLNLHNYFLARAIDAVRPGGVVVAVTTHGTLDNNAQQRSFLASRANLVAAIRLPNNAFEENAKTKVVTDILVLQKRQAAEPEANAWRGVATVKLTDEDGNPVEHRVNEYFVAHPEMVLGRQSMTGSMYRANEYTVEPTAGSLDEKLSDAIKRIPEGVVHDTKDLRPLSSEHEPEDAESESRQEGHLGRNLSMEPCG